MNREEQIRQASIEYTLKNRPMCIGGDSFAELADEINRNPAFEEGAKWANMHPVNVWHDAGEFPNKALPIIVEIDDDIELSYEVISIDETDEKFWEYLVSDRDITRWAYVKDLLPKEGKK